METDTKKLFQITEAAHACGLSSSTLMRMEEKGMLTPAFIAPNSLSVFGVRSGKNRKRTAESCAAAGMPGIIRTLLRRL